MSKVTVYIPRWTGVDNTLVIEEVEGDRTEKQIRIPRRRSGGRYEILDPATANYTVEDALAVMQRVVDSEVVHAQWILNQAAQKQAQIDQYLAEEAS